MYIPEFWAGVGATILSEVALLTLALIVSFAKDKKNKRK